MTLVPIRIGSLVNVHVFDDADYDSAIETIMPIKAGDPVDPNDVVTLGSMSFGKLAVPNVDDPSQLGAVAGKNGDVVVVQQVNAAGAIDAWTLYAYDASGPAIDSPYVVDALGAGSERWVAIGGRYSAISHTTNSPIRVPDLAFSDGTWNGSLEVPTRNSLRNKFLLMVSDAVFGIAWDGVTDVTASHNRLYDKLITLATIQAPGGPHTIPLAKITPGGVNGSITFNAEGVVTAFVDPT